MRKQISAEDTFPDDLPLEQCDVHIRRRADKVWAASRDNARGAKTIGHEAEDEGIHFAEGACLTAAIAESAL